MKKWVITFLLLRIIAYVVITMSYTNHGISFWLLFVLFLVIELNVWIDFFLVKKDSKKLLKNLQNNLKK